MEALKKPTPRKLKGRFIHTVSIGSSYERQKSAQFSWRNTKTGVGGQPWLVPGLHASLS